MVETLITVSLDIRQALGEIMTTKTQLYTWENVYFYFLEIFTFLWKIIAGDERCAVFYFHLGS